MSSLVRCFVATGTMVLFSTVGSSQSAEVNGRASDASGAIVVGAKVTIVNSDTGATRETTTNSLGYYSLPALSPGHYSISAEKPGFRVVRQSGITLEVDQHAAIEFLMQVGDLTQEISVQAAAPLLNTVEPSIGQVIDNRQIVSLPLNGRDYANLALLSGGTANPIAGSRARRVQFGRSAPLCQQLYSGRRGQQQP